MILKPYVLNKTVTAAGTRERIVGSGLKSIAVTIQAKSDNTGSIYVGDETVSSSVGIELHAGDSITFNSVEFGLANADISFRDIWIDVSVSSEGINIIYLERD